jgi:hypothetical protein
MDDLANLARKTQQKVREAGDKVIRPPKPARAEQASARRKPSEEVLEALPADEEPAAPTPGASPPPQPEAVAAVVPSSASADGIAFRDAGEWVADQFRTCRQGLGPAGVLLGELVFFCNSRTRLRPTGAAAFFGTTSGPGGAAPLLHLALGTRELAMVYAADGRMVVACKGPYEAASWSFTEAPADAARHSSGPTHGARTHALTLVLPSGEFALALNPGEGYTALRLRLAQLALERARVNFAEGKYCLADKLLGRIGADYEADQVARLKEQIGTLVEVRAMYQGGHPMYLDKDLGLLRLDAVGLEFVSLATQTTLRIAYDRLAALLEPQRGEFSAEMLQAVQRKQTAAAWGGAAAGIVGALMSAAHVSGAKLISEVGEKAARGVKGKAKLGAPPRNRLCAVLLEDGVKHRVLFDVVAGTREEMEAHAGSFWNRSAKVRSRFARPGRAPAARTEAAAGLNVLPQIAALKQLKGLLDDGILTPDEFNQQKAALLGQIPARLAAAAEPPVADPADGARSPSGPRLEKRAG